MHNQTTQAKKLRDLCRIIYIIHSTYQHGIEIYEIKTSHIGKQRTLYIEINGVSYNHK